MIIFFQALSEGRSTVPDFDDPWSNPPASFCFPSQAVSRITERDGVTSEDAERRLQSQWSNAKQVEHANVVLSTLWEKEVTQKQASHTISLGE